MPLGIPPDASDPEPERDAARLLRPTRRELFLGSATLSAGMLLGREFARRGPQTRPEPATLPGTLGAWLPPDHAPTGIRIQAVGDIGAASEVRALTVAEMRQRARLAPPDLVLMLGDNFYPEGVRGVADPRWELDFERLFDGPEFAVPFHACLGNHDHNGDVEAQVAYTERSARWRMPARFHAFERRLCPCASAEFFVLDTHPMYMKHPCEEQIAWLDAALARSRATWKIVVGHHCIRSFGHHGPMQDVARRIQPLLREHGVDAYLSGHDHDLQLLRTEDGWHQLVCGTGSSLRDTGWGPESLFAASTPAFAELWLDHDALRFDLVAARRGVVFSHRVMARRPTASLEGAG